MTCCATKPLQLEPLSSILASQLNHNEKLAYRTHRERETGCRNLKDNFRQSAEQLATLVAETRKWKTEWKTTPVFSFQDNRGKLVPECQTILDFAAARSDEVAAVTTKTQRCRKLQSNHYHQHTNAHLLETWSLSCCQTNSTVLKHWRHGRQTMTTWEHYAPKTLDSFVHPHSWQPFHRTLGGALN